MSLFFFGNNFYKNKETFKIFSLQLLEVYRILLVEPTLESIMFHYTFSVIKTMFVPCTALLYDSTTATWTLKSSTTLLSISCGIHLIFFLLSVYCFHRLFFSGQTYHAWPSYSQDFNLADYFLSGYLKDRVCENNPQTREDIISKKIRWISQEMLNRVVDNFNVRVAAVEKKSWKFTHFCKS